MSAPDNYRFVVANDKLFAVRHGGSYGTETGALSTADDGDSWTEIDVPHKTISLGGHDGRLIALTSNAELFTQEENGTNWKRFWSSSGQRYIYDLSCAPLEKSTWPLRTELSRWSRMVLRVESTIPEWHDVRTRLFCG